MAKPKLCESDIRALSNLVAEHLLAEFSIRGETQEVDKETLTTIITGLVEHFLEPCPHKTVDRAGSVFGETCTDCGLYLNNGF